MLLVTAWWELGEMGIVEGFIVRHLLRYPALRSQDRVGGCSLLHGLRKTPW